MPVRYCLKDDGAFVIEEYNLAKPFASFLPGIAGPWGKPIWVFYVNRGQAITSFGARDRNGCLLEYHPANKAYAQVFVDGFRTFLRVKGRFYEPFAQPMPGADLSQTMIVRPYEIELGERHPGLGLQIRVIYHTLPSTPTGALVRTLRITNLDREAADLELLDGLPVFVPANMSEIALKGIAYTEASFCRVADLDDHLLYAYISVRAADAVRMEETTGGNFYFGLVEEAKSGNLTPLPLVADPGAIFGEGGSHLFPAFFLAENPFDPERRVRQGIIPCAFVHHWTTLGPGEDVVIHALAGRAETKVEACRLREACREPGFLTGKREENRRLIRTLMDYAFCLSDVPIFDRYCQQTFLDNTLRGGLPALIGDKIFYLYFRRHGDLERDYNFFSLEPTYFSQGNANYRDLNQNRRTNVLFFPAVGDTDIRTFFGAIQADGYNPLVYEGIVFRLDGAKPLPKEVFKDEEAAESFSADFAGEFTPGEVAAWALAHREELALTPMDFLGLVLSHAEKRERFTPADGYWSDHWSYCLDLLQSHESIFPERMEALLFGCGDYTYYDNPEVLLPNDRRYVWDPEQGACRRYRSTEKHPAKLALLAARREDEHLVRAGNGKGPIYRTTLAEKILCLICTRLSMLDPDGVGLEMLGNRPGWNDALNGLPSLLGSSFCETVALYNLIAFFARHVARHAAPTEIAVELRDLLRALDGALKQQLATATPDPRLFWEAANAARDAYCAQTLLGFSGEKVALGPEELRSFLGDASRYLAQAIARARKDDGLYHTYFFYEVTEYEFVRDEAGNQIHQDGLPLVRPLAFRRHHLPHFLEGQIHALGVVEPSEARRLYQAVRASDLYDTGLGLYKINASLAGAPPAIGRVTRFLPGWLENESIWIHLNYKYLLALLRAGLYEEFFTEMRQVLVAFHPPERYGRNPLEHSSFIVSSAHPDRRLHGRGFYARLTGATAEFLSMYLIMTGLARAFVLDEAGEPRFRPRPILPDWLFTSAPRKVTLQTEESQVELDLPAGTFASRLFGGGLLIYYNPQRKPTFGPEAAKVVRFVLTDREGRQTCFEGDTLPAAESRGLREGRYVRVEITLA